MKNTIIPIPSKSIEAFAFTDDKIIMSSKKHKTIDSLLNSVDKSGMLESLKIIPFSGLNEITYNEESSSIKLGYVNEKGKNKNTKVLFESTEVRNAVVDSMKEIKTMQESIQPENKIKRLLINCIWILLAALIAVGLVAAAMSVASGEEIEISGRRSGLKRILVTVAGILGPIGTGIIGGIGVLGTLFNAFNRWKNPAGDVQLIA